MQVSVLNVGMPAPIPDGFPAVCVSTKREHQQVEQKQPAKMCKLVDFSSSITSSGLCPKECVYAVVELCKFMDLGIPIFSKTLLFSTWKKSFGYLQISCEICGMSTYGIGSSAEEASNAAAFRMLWHLASMSAKEQVEEILTSINFTLSDSRKPYQKSIVASLVYLRQFLERRPRTGVSRPVSPEIVQVAVEAEIVDSPSETQVQQATCSNSEAKDTTAAEPETKPEETKPEKAKPASLEQQPVPVHPQPTSSDVKPAEIVMRRIPFRPQLKQNLPVVVTTKSLVVPSPKDMDVYSQLLTAALTNPKENQQQPCNGALTMTPAVPSFEEGGTCSSSEATDFVSEIKMYCDRNRLKELYEYLPFYDAGNPKEPASFTAKLTIDRSEANLPTLEALGHARNKKLAKKNAAEAMFMSLKPSPA